MKLKNAVLIGILAAAAVSTAGCGKKEAVPSDTAAQTEAAKQTDAGQTEAQGNSEEEAPADNQAVLSQKPTGKRLVLVTNNASDGRGVWLSEHAQEAGFNVEIVALGAGDATARVISEINNPTTNVIWGPSEDQFTAMAEAGSLAKFTPEWAEDVKGLSKENGYSWSYEIQPKLLVCNPDVYTEETAPKSYQDLWEKEEFHGKYAVPTTFDGNTNRAIVGGILVQYLDPAGELGVSDEGWKAIKAYFDNGYKTPKGENDFGNMASGKVPITFTFASGLKGKSESYNIKPLIVYTEVGEPTNTNQIAVVANKDQEMVEESMRFANWLGSAEVIGAYAAENGNMVANKKAEDSMVPIIKEVKEHYKPQEADWAYVNSMMDDWVAKIQLEIY
ncbi:ABC transporter substrate-binding protein [Hungatella hathewayi]|uniref:ABC transporter substrate-binding protein n=1 Tax=Hungatella hathewayi TaxID=154046 RepID=UPI0011DCA2FC|nr:ABC transporter substrate-binding protein [Hungatella hathewayi]